MKNQEHERLRDLPTEDGELLIGGQKVSRLALRAGRTPFYVYDRAAISKRIAHLRQALPERVHIHYAIKANPMPALLGHMRPLVDGFDVASANEMRVALDSGMTPDNISFAGPGKRDEELLSAVGAGTCINCESETELARIRNISEQCGIRARVAIRVNPDFELKGAGMKMSGSPKQFGIDAERVPAAIRAALDYGLDFEGLHIFCGSQNLRSEAIIEANAKTLELAAQLARETGVAFRSLNIGGGYGIPYFPGERSIDLSAIGTALGENLPRHGEALGGVEIIVELGRYLVGEAGYYVCRVVDIKTSRGETFVMVDGGLHHHLANSGNFGQILRKNYPVAVGNRLARPRHLNVTIVGPLCTPLDIVAEKLDVPDTRIDDLIIVFQSGAYGQTASPQDFLNHGRALELCC